MMEQITQETVESDVIIVTNNPAVVGELRLHKFSSAVFQNTRFLRVWLPPGYNDPENSERYYPVFYLNDGQNLFDRSIAFAGVEWAVDETADRLIGENSVPPMILVGIDNAQKDRAREYLPYRAFNPPILRPKGKRYPEFLIDEIMPFLFKRYRIARGPENTGIGGSSLGAIISLFVVLDRPGIFGRLLLESPSLFVSNRRLLKYSHAFRHWPEKIFMAIGTREAGRADQDMQVVNDVLQLERILRRAGLAENRLRVLIDEGATHSEGEWAKRFPEALTFLFGRVAQPAL
jgi:predicted alpha/beta superfamily hydrolase